MRIAAPLFLISFIFFLLGCDPAYRVRRDSSQLDYLISFDCLKSSVENTPNVKIAQNAVLNSRNVCQDDLISRQILYTVNGEPITVTGCYLGETLKTFSQDQGGWVGNQKYVNVPVILKTMREVESTIEKRCKAKGLTSAIKNNCLRIDCIE